MNLDYYVQQLLYSFDCVIIPNFGGIVAQPIGASIHATQHIFYAPKKQLAFNRNLNISDGLLINHVALNQSISFKEATEWVNVQVQTWKKELTENNKLSVAEVGRFFVDKESTIQFEPATFSNYNAEAFGCTSFHATPVNEVLVKTKQKIQPIFIDKAKLQSAKKINFKKLVPYAVALPLIAVALYIPIKTDLFKGINISYSNLNPFASTKQTSINYSERIPVALPAIQAFVQPQETAKVEQQALESIMSAPKETSITEITTQSVNNNIHLIVGAFSSVENANELITELNSKGFHAYIQGKNASGLFRVSCDNYSDKNEAESAKANIKEQGIDAWVLQE